MRPTILAAVTALFFTFSTHADDATNPIRWTWIASSCETWNCAAAAFVLSNGDRNVIALPTGGDEHPWVLLKRVEEGSVYIPDEEPYGCQVYASVPEAETAFVAMDPCHAPIILNVPDRRAVVIFLKDCATGEKRRAVR